MMQTIDPDYAESFGRSLDLPQSAPLIGPSHNSGERLPIDKAESGADTPPTASAPDVREVVVWQARKRSPPYVGWTSWFAISIAEKNYFEEEIAKGNREIEIRPLYIAPPVADREAIAGEFEPVGTQYLHYSPFTGHEVWLDRDFYNGHRATVSREVFARKSALALLHPQPAKGERP